MSSVAIFNTSLCDDRKFFLLVVYVTIYVTFFEIVFFSSNAFFSYIFQCFFCHHFKCYFWHHLRFYTWHHFRCYTWHHFRCYIWHDFQRYFWHHFQCFFWIASRNVFDITYRAVFLHYLRCCFRLLSWYCRALIVSSWTQLRMLFLTSFPVSFFWHHLWCSFWLQK